MSKKTCIALFALALVSAGCGESQPPAAATPETPTPAATPAPAPAETAPSTTQGTTPGAATGDTAGGATGGTTGGATTPKPITVTMNAASGSKVQGTVELTEVADGVRVVAQFSSTPPGKHGFHVHEKGDCSDPQAKSAGDHFAPGGHKHGLPEATERHLGDMGNVTVPADGTAKVELVIKGANLKATDPHSLVNRALILHEKEDKGTQPSGDAGGRIACGVIKQP